MAFPSTTSKTTVRKRDVHQGKETGPETICEIETASRKGITPRSHGRLRPPPPHAIARVCGSSVWPVGLMDKASASGAGDSRFESRVGHLLQALSNDANALGTDRAKTSRGPTANHDMEERQQQTWPPWPNGQGIGLLIRRLWVRVPQGGA